MSFSVFGCDFSFPRTSRVASPLLRLSKKMPSIDPILTEPKQYQYIPILSGAGNPSSNTFNTLARSHQSRPHKDTMMCLKIAGKWLQIASKFTKVNVVPKKHFKSAHVAQKCSCRMKFRRQGTNNSIYSNTYWVLIQANNPIYFQYLLDFSSIIQYNT